MIRRVIYGLALGIVAATVWAGMALAQGPIIDELVEAAAQLYEIGDHDGAAAAYEEAVAMGARDAAVYHNLGAAHLAAGRPVPAVLAFRRALALRATDSAAREGLEAARAALEAPSPPARSAAQEAAAQVTSFISPWVLVGAAIAAGALCAVGWAIFRMARSLPLRISALSVAAALAIFSGLAAVVVSIESGRDSHDAVVMQQVELLTGPGDSYVGVLDLPAGAEVEILEDRGEWVRLMVPLPGQDESAQGWAEADGLQRVIVPGPPEAPTAP